MLHPFFFTIHPLLIKASDDAHSKYFFETPNGQCRAYIFEDNHALI